MALALAKPTPPSLMAIQRFHVIEDGVVILRSKGVYRQAKVYHRGIDVFAAYGGGFIKLGPRTDTTHPHVAWDAVEAECVVCDRAGGQPRYAG